MYSTTYISFLLVPILNMIYQRKDLLFKMIYPFDHTPIYVFIPLVLSNILVATLVVTMVYGESMVIGELLLHLNQRYLLLRQDLKQRTEKLLKRNDAANISLQFRQVIVDIIKRNVELNKFAEEIQAEFSFRIFLWFTFSAALLCALGFKAYTVSCCIGLDLVLLKSKHNNCVFVFCFFEIESHQQHWLHCMDVWKTIGITCHW